MNNKDTIYRQSAIDAVVELCKHYTPTKSIKHPHIDFVIEELNNVPSAPLERKMGKWIYYDPNGFKCSRCGSYLEIECGDVKMNYCPNCGSYNGNEEE